MRKVDLKMNEQNKYSIIKKLVETNCNKKTVLLKSLKKQSNLSSSE